MRARRRPSIAVVRCVALMSALALALSAAAPAHAATPSLTGFSRMAAPLLERLTQQQQEQEEERRDPPAVIDPASGPVFSVFGGSVFSGSSAFQTGAALAYFFGPKASFGIEGEGNITFGPGGRVYQFLGSFVLQTGARTSKFVPFIALGAGALRASNQYPEATTAALADLGIDPQPRSETAPFFHFGGGVRVYVKPGMAFRADVRFAQVALDLEDVSFSDSLFPMRRVVGMLSWDF